LGDVHEDLFCDWLRTHDLLLTISHTAFYKTANKPLLIFTLTHHTVLHTADRFHGLTWRCLFYFCQFCVLIRVFSVSIFLKDIAIRFLATST